MITLSVLPPTMHPKASRIEAIYAKLPRLNCQRKCQESCGPIGMSAAELSRIEHEAGPIPEAAKSLAAGFEAFVSDPTTCCPLLKVGECSIYKIRPLICRLWGLVKSMRCPFGCEPERWLTDKEGGALLREIDSL